MGEPEDWIVVPVQAGDLSGVELDLLEEHPAGRLHELTADLVLDIPGIHRQTRVDCAIQVPDRHPSGLLVHLELRDRAAV